MANHIRKGPKGMSFKALAAVYQKRNKSTCYPDMDVSSRLTLLVDKTHTHNSLPQGEALQFHRRSFRSRHSVWEMNFYFGLVFSHCTCDGQTTHKRIHTVSFINDL